ncbi:MAG: alpha/beta fold hydrolase [Vitreimonas sp.]
MRVLSALASAVLCLAMSGTVSAQPQPDAAAVHDPAIGSYAFADGREIYVNYLADAGGLLLVEYPSGRVRLLHRDSGENFSIGPTIGAPTPTVAQIAFTQNSVRWHENGESTGQRLRFAHEDVSIHSGAITLAGTITFPRGRGPFPAVVLLHGGLAETRDFLWVTDFFARRGVAVLAYDKRGSGQSGGDWRTASAYDLADDALAAVHVLRARRDVVHDRIGLYASSAGNWVAPIVATRTDVAWVIGRAVTALPERENLIFEASSDLRANGFDDAAIAAAQALHRRWIAVTDANGAGWNDLRTALSAASHQPWFQFARLPGQLPEWNEANRAQILDIVDMQRRNIVETPALWAQVRRPLLLQNGTLDIYVPGVMSAEALQRAVDTNPNALVRIYPRGDHGLFESEHGYGRDIPGVSRFVPGYLTDMDAFIARYAVRR